MVGAYFAAERISVLADRPVYHWVRREEAPGASYERFDPAGYFDNVREVLDLVEARTEPGAWRDTLLAHWYRGKMLGRVGGFGWRRRDEEWRRDALRGDPQARAGALRRERPRPAPVQPRACALSCCAQATTRGWSGSRASRTACGRASRCAGSSAAAPIWCCGWSPGWATSAPACAGSATATACSGCPPPTTSRRPSPRSEREATGLLRRATVNVWLHNVADDAEYLLPARTEVKLDKGATPERIRPRLITSVPIAPTAAAAGGPLPPGTWEVRAEVSIAGFSHARDGRAPREEPLLVTTFAPGRIVVGSVAPPPPPLPARVYRRLPAPVMQTFRRTRATAAAVSRR